MSEPSLADEIVGLSLAATGLSVAVTAGLGTVRARQQRPLNVSALGRISGERQKKLQRQVRELRIDSPGQIHALRNMALVMRDRSWSFGFSFSSILLGAGVAIQEPEAPWLRDLFGDFFRPLAAGPPQPLREIPATPSRMIHFFPPAHPKLVAKVPELAPLVDVLPANLEDGVPAADKEAARALADRDLDLFSRYGFRTD